MRKILVLRGGALGDFLVTLPALAALRRRWPDAGIELAGNATAAELAVAEGLLSAVHSQDEARWGSLFASAPLSPEFAGWLAGFDLVVSYWPDPGGELRHRFPLRPDQIFLAGTAHPAHGPAAAHYCEPLRTLGLDLSAHLYRFRTLLGSHLPAASRTIAVHPGSGSLRKNWPAARWLELLARLPDPVLLVLGEVERAAWTPRIADLDPARFTIAADLPLRELATQLAACRLFVGHDSGISHLAAACGLPAVLLFGPTDPRIWAPPAPGMTVIQRGATLDAIDVDDVLRTIASIS